MNILNRIEYYRKMRGMTEQELGLEIGLPKKLACHRISQFEDGTMIPKPDMRNSLATALHVNPYDLSAHVFSCGDDLARALLVLEETGEFQIVPEEDQVCIRFVNPDSDASQELLEALRDATFDRTMYGFLENSYTGFNRKDCDDYREEVAY